MSLREVSYICLVWLSFFEVSTSMQSTGGKDEHDVLIDDSSNIYAAARGAEAKYSMEKQPAAAPKASNLGEEAQTEGAAANSTSESGSEWLMGRGGAGRVYNGGFYSHRGIGWRAYSYYSYQYYYYSYYYAAAGRPMPFGAAVPAMRRPVVRGPIGPVVMKGYFQGEFKGTFQKAAMGKPLRRAKLAAAQAAAANGDGVFFDDEEELDNDYFEEDNAFYPYDYGYYFTFPGRTIRRGGVPWAGPGGSVITHAHSRGWRPWARAGFASFREWLRHNAKKTSTEEHTHAHEGEQEHAEGTGEGEKEEGEGNGEDEQESSLIELDNEGHGQTGLHKRSKITSADLRASLLSAADETALRDASIVRAGKGRRDGQYDVADEGVAPEEGGMPDQGGASYAMGGFMDGDQANMFGEEAGGKGKGEGKGIGGPESSFEEGAVRTGKGRLGGEMNGGESSLHEDGSAEEGMMADFQNMDLNADGVLSKEEAFDAMDKNKDGVISKDEYLESDLDNFERGRGFARVGKGRQGDSEATDQPAALEAMARTGKGRAQVGQASSLLSVSSKELTNFSEMEDVEESFSSDPALEE